MLSVDHADIVDRYRSASAIETRSQSGSATTEDLRQAMKHYRALFDALLGSSLTSVYGDGDGTGTGTGTTEATTRTSTGRRGSRVGPDA
jgi:hypothetical protein